MSLGKSSRGSATGRTVRSGRGKSAQSRVIAGRARVKAKTKAAAKVKIKPQSKLQAKADARRQEPMEPEWEEMSGNPELIPGLEGMLEKPVASYGTDAEARRRIEMLREERLLQQTLSDVFDL